VQIAVGIVAALAGLLAAGQLLSVLSWPLAQRLGLQERAGGADPLFTRLERNTARWDQLTMWWLPVAGVLMLADHSWWPQLALVGGAVYVDTGGREAAKLLALRGGGVRVGGVREQRRYLVGTAVMAAAGLAAIAVALHELA
jgi:hypothetical protein